MATHSIIAYQDPTTQKYPWVYCYWDGSVSNNGQILEKVYDNLELVKKLISKGDISRMLNGQEDIGRLYAPSHYYLWRGKGWDNIEPNITNDLESLFKLANDLCAKYLYVFTDGKWLYSDNLNNANSLQSLTDAVENLDITKKFPLCWIDLIKDSVSAFYGVPVTSTTEHA